MEAKDFLRRLSDVLQADAVKPEITQSMIELNSAVHQSHTSLLEEVTALRSALVKDADETHIGICGGGAHPFQRWKEQRIFKTERFASFSEQYGYLAKQFTVFGQHIHIGCDNADDALYLCHAMAQYIPHFIALSAASPFNQEIDTAFDCSRLAIISAFPLSGTPPWILSWDEFQAYYAKLINLDIIKSMKDFYWDIRPKPEFGTVELRICDTPLTIEKAVDLAAFAQTLACWILETRPQLSRDVYLTYLINRFRAARYGMDAIIIDPVMNMKHALAEQIEMLCRILKPYAVRYHCEIAIARIADAAAQRRNGAGWLRKRFAELQSLNDVVRSQVDVWRYDGIDV
jgi:carboxylate-amine ligase